MIAQQCTSLSSRLYWRNVKSGLFNCHHKGLHSLVLEERPDGSLLRIFYATNEHTMDKLYRDDGHFVIGAHNHDKALAFTTLYGDVQNVEVAIRMTKEKGSWKGYMYPFITSALLEGGFKIGQPEECSAELIWSPINGKRLATTDVHTVVVPGRSGAWLIEEGPKQDAPKWILSPQRGLALDSEGLYLPMNPQEIARACDTILEGMTK